MLAGWAALIAGAVAWGAAGGDGDASQMGAPPFMGHWRFAVTWRVLPALALALVVFRVAPGWSIRLPWRRLVLAAMAGAALWALALNFVDGAGALTAPLETRYEYGRWVDRVDSPGEFLRTFVDRLPTEATHVKSHPPGMVLVLWGLDRIGLGGSGAEAVLILTAVGVGVGAVLVSLGHVAGQDFARRAAPFVAFLPAAVWMATSPDAFFFGVMACGVAGVVIAARRRGPATYGWAVAGGLFLGAGLFLSYGMAALLALPAAVVLWSRRWDVGLAASAAMASVVLLFAAAGFWWLDGLSATHDRYRGGVGAHRSDTYFLFANLAVLAVAVGPAVAVGMSRLRGLRRLLLPGAALGTLIAIDISGLSEGEVERIWLPFVPWVAAGAAAVGTRLDEVQRWLGLHVAGGVLLQIVLRSPW